MASMRRRDFLRAAATTIAAAGSIRAAAPVSRVIDTHVHFYDPSRPQGVPWPPKNSKLYRPVYPADYLKVAAASGVSGVVVVEASAWIEDDQWLLDLADREKLIKGIVGRQSVGEKEFDTQLKQYSANPLFRGIRMSGPQLATQLLADQTVADLKKLAAAGLSLDLICPPLLLPVVNQLAGRIGDLRIIIDHVAQVGPWSKGINPQWAAGIAAVGKHANVFCKVSALAEQTGLPDGTSPRDVNYYKPVIDAVVNAFGEDRVLYGSNWPVSDRGASFEVVHGIVHDYFTARGAEAAEKYFWRNSKTAYQWLERN